MPLVQVKYDPKRLAPHQAKELGKFLQFFVAKALDVPKSKKARLTHKDIEIEFRERGPLDINVLPLQITVFANRYRARKKNLDERTNWLAKETRRFLSGPGGYDPILIGKKKAFVWIMLVDASFVMI